MNYYAVERSSDHLAHYGVKGMKWGVRKAIEKGNTKALSRHYNRAAKKLAKLNKRTDAKVQAENAEKYNRIAKRAGKVGAVGVGTLAGLHLSKDVNRALYNLYTKKSADAYDKYYNSDIGNFVGRKYRDISTSYDNSAGKAWDRWNFADDSLSTEYGGYRSLIGRAARGVAVGGLGTAAVAKGKAMVAKHRTTAKGHATAVAKRDAWKKEMQSAFKGTQYDASTGSMNKKRRKNNG